MAPAMKAQDVVDADAGPIARPLIYQPAGDIEGTLGVVLLQHGSAHRRRAFRHIVEGEADHRPGVWQLKRRRAQMPGQPVADARF